MDEHQRTRPVPLPVVKEPQLLVMAMLIVPVVAVVEVVVAVMLVEVVGLVEHVRPALGIAMVVTGSPSSLKTTMLPGVVPVTLTNSRFLVSAEAGSESKQMAARPATRPTTPLPRR